MRRELNEIEYLNWCFGQPYNIVLCVQLRGDLAPDRLRAALDRAQERHPLLRVSTELGPRGVPWFSSDGVGAIPLSVVERAGPDDAQTLAEHELGARFARDQQPGGAPRPPLVRASLLRPREPARPTGLVLTAQHVIADGLSMVFLLRDLLRFLEQSDDRPDAPVAVLDAPARAQELMPARGWRRKLQRPLVALGLVGLRIVLALGRAYVRLRLGRRAAAPRERPQHHLSWVLTPDQTRRLRARSRAEGVSIQSAIATAFLPGFRAIHTPVNLRPFLATPVGESVGLYVGSADLKMTYRPRRGFWDNARRFHRRLRRALRDPFRIFRLFSKAVPAAAVQELGQLVVRIVGDQRLLAITNLGQLDGSGLALHGRTLIVEAFFGAVTGLVDSSVLTVYTIDGRMHLQLLATEAGPSDTSVRDDAARAVRTLLEEAGG